MESTYMVLVFLLFIFTGVYCISPELHLSCPQLDYPNTVIIHHHATPFGNVSAGHYTKIKEAITLHDCVMACCSDNTCNVAFMFNISCYLIQCRSFRLCKPLDRKGQKFEKSYMALVRSQDNSWEDDNFSDFKTASDFYVEDENFSRDAEEAVLNSALLESGIFSAAVEDKKVSPKSCVYGIEIDCSETEQCIVKNSRSRSGICHCIDGYERDIKGHCKQKHLVTLAVDSHSASSESQGSANKENATTQSYKPENPTTVAPVHLVVSAGDNVTLHLPDNGVILSAYALNTKGDDENLKYEWTLISHPEGDETGTMEAQNTKNLKLSKLRAGIYTFKVTVTSNNAAGDATVNVTVLPPERANKPPVAIIQPANVTIKLPNKETVLDGSFSTDDDKIVKFQWEVLQVPIGYSVQLNETPTLQIKNLIPGLYRFKLTVTDSKGASNFTFANVTVQKETDYPPTANAKSEVVIYLPQNEVVLNGNLSTDDKGIKSWEWKKSPDTDKAVDMEGTNSPYLHLSQLEVGVYKFILKVTDTADQTSTTEVHLFVKPESNTPPTAVVNADQKVTLPLKNPVVLDGSQSKDDIKIVKYEWKQVQGPKPAVISSPTAATTEVTGLAPGFYQFMLTVYDEKDSQASALANITVIQTINMPPQANAGGDKTVLLPCDLVIMNGSLSTDDVAIVKYKWTRDPSSLAAGTVLENSDESPVLKLIGLIPGRYLFRLTVSDLQGSSSSDTASLIVRPPPSLMDQVEVMINADIKSFTQEQQDTLLRQLEMLLHTSDPVRVKLIKLDSDRNSRRVILIFVVEKTSALNSGLVPGINIVSRLKNKLRTDSSLLDLEVLSLDTVVCQNKCSGHGTCDQYTKRCICEAFWMQDVFRINFGDKESNCDWSILYVIIVSFTVVVALAAVIWGFACCFTRMSFRKPKKKHRYTLLDDFNEREREREKFIPKSKAPKNSSLMISESESDAIFESQRIPLTTKTVNGSLPNGLVRDVHNVKA